MDLNEIVKICVSWFFWVGFSYLGGMIFIYKSWRKVFYIRKFEIWWLVKEGFFLECLDYFSF